MKAKGEQQVSTHGACQIMGSLTPSISGTRMVMSSNWQRSVLCMMKPSMPPLPARLWMSGSAAKGQVFSFLAKTVFTPRPFQPKLRLQCI